MILSDILAVAISNCSPGGAGISCDTNLPNIQANSANLQSILQIVFGVIAAATVIFIIVSALRYSVSLGDPQATAKIRNTIVYAAIGLVIALTAELLVTLTLNRVAG